MKRIATIILLMLAFMLISSTAPAQEAKNYVSGRLGAYFPTAGSMDSYDAGGGVEIAIGRYINRNIALEFGLGAFGTYRDDFIGNNPRIGFYSASDSIGAMMMNLSLKALYPVNEKVEIYGIGGIGVYFISFERDYSSSLIGDFTVNDDETKLGGHLGAGVLYNPNKKFFVAGEFRYIFLPSADFSPLGETASYDLSGPLVTVSAGMRF